MGPAVAFGIALALVVAFAPAGAAARPVEVAVARDVPFSAAALEAALAVRLPADGPPVAVDVIAAPGGVIVTIDGASRTVPLGERRGALAARLVALAASDLVLADLAVAPEPPPRVEGRGARAGRSPALRLGVTGEVAPGWSGALGGLTVDVALGRGAWVAAFDAGVASAFAAPLAVTAGVLRLGAGYRLGPALVRAGVVAVPLAVHDGVGDRTVLVGGTASVRLGVPLGGAAVVVAAGVDAFATRTEYQMAAAPVAATPWISPWIAAGVEVAP